MKPPKVSKEERVGRTDRCIHTKPNEDFDAYIRKDYRVKCAWCRRFMRYNPTDATPARRRPPPNAGTCTECPILKTTPDGQVRLIHEEQLYN